MWAAQIRDATALRSGIEQIRTALLALTVLLAAVAPCSAQAQCVRGDMAAHLAVQIEKTQAFLLSVRVKDDDATQVPKTAQPAITALKDLIAGFVDLYMACAPAGTSTATVMHDLGGLRRQTSQSSAVNVYGDRLHFAVKQHAPDVVAIVTTFDVPCGDDAMLLVYQRNNEGWRRVLRWQSKAYDTVAGALWSFDYALSPRDASGKWFVAVKSVAPWCSSTWSEIRYAILRPSSDANAPKVIQSGSDSMWWGGDDVGATSASENSVDVRYHGESSGDAGDMPLHVLHFRVTGDRVERTK